MAIPMWDRARGKYMTTAAHFCVKRPLVINTQIPLVSFTFDDFPRSALLSGGAILQRFGVRGTYYASFGLMGKEAPTGPIFLPEDLKVALEQGHEVGCHTFGHCDAWETKANVFEGSIIENQRALDRVAPGARFRTLSYPISPPRVGTKRKVGRHFVCCRAGGQTFNVGSADLNYLSGYFLEKSRDNPEGVKNVIRENARERGWLIFATHDICKSPTPYGCTPEFFEQIVQAAVDSGARILPVFEAWKTICTSFSS